MNPRRRAEEWIRQQELIDPGDTVLVALSGGADSVCLIRMLLELRDKLKIQVLAAHYNHCLRGADSNRDEAFVRAFCSQWDVPLAVGWGDVTQAASDTRQGIEETARQLRYAFLQETADQLGANKIATGHNADDNAETVLLHLIRGAGLRGLSGIPPRRGAIIRPLLSVQRQEIEAYLAELDQPYGEDATNQDVHYRRNALRHEVLPLLKDKNPNLAGTLLRQSELLRQDSRFLDELATETFARLRRGAEEMVLPIQDLLDLDPAISSRVIALAIQAADGEAEQVHIRQVLGLIEGSHPSAQISVGGGVIVRRVYDQLMIVRDHGQSAPFTPSVLPPSGRIFLPGAEIWVSCGENSEKIHETIHTFLFKSDAICGKITVRPRRVGDSIRIFGGNGTKTIKKLMIAHKIPAHQRDQWPILADEAGVIAVPGIGIDQRVAPKPGDKTLQITVGKAGL
ncbi:MAG: tRNA lysidine(34) synthetase TilS [Oscillospiraceae bacterium]|nr:tRNA lysidine(34) synthetase TilS [Oscillospiraceae bacterium]